MFALPKWLTTIKALLATADGKFLKRVNGAWAFDSGAGGVTDHGDLTGLDADDHPLYLNKEIYSKSLQLAGTGTSLTNYHLELTVYYGSGTDGGAVVYLGGKCKTDFSDLRFTDASNNYLNYWLKSKVDGTSAVIICLIPSIPASPVATIINILYGFDLSGNDFKIGLIADMHYGSTDIVETYKAQYRTQALNWTDSFNTRMLTFKPNLIASLGDNTTAINSGEKTSLMTAMVNKMAENPFPIALVTGNHDFQYATPAEVLGVLGAFPYWETGKLYGSFDLGDYHFVVLDTSYDPTTPFAHLTASGGAGNGYIPDGTAGSDDELGWLATDLAATNKKTIILNHATLEEFDSTTYYTIPDTSFDRFSVTNRAAVRAVLESSGKVIAVFEGHQHFTRCTTVNGIPYIQCPAMTYWAVYPTRLLADTDKGQWAEVTFNDRRKEIKIDLYEDDSVEGAQLSVSHTIYYSTSMDTDKPNNPYATFALGYDSQIGTASSGSSSFMGGELTDWHVVTTTTNDAPVDLLLAHATILQPNKSGAALVIKGGSTATAGSAKRFFASQTGKFECCFSFRKEETNKRANIYLTNTAESIGPYIGFNTLGNIVYNDGTDHIIQAYSANQWYDIVLSIDLAADTFAISINGAAGGTGLGFANALAVIDTFKIEALAGQNFTAYLDNVYFKTWESTAPEALYWSGQNVQQVQPIQDKDHAAVTQAEKDGWNATAEAVLESTSFISFVSEVSITAVTTLDTGAFGKNHVCSGTSADYAVTLPSPTGNAGKVIGLRMSSALTKIVTIDAGTGVAIDGSQTRLMWTSEVAILLCTGTGWVKIAGKSIPMKAGIYAAAAQVFSAAAVTQINIDTALVTPSVAAMHDTANKQIKILRAGEYLVDYRMRWASTNATAYACNVYTKKNGSTLFAISDYIKNGTAPFTGSSQPAVLAVNDLLQLHGFYDAGSFSPDTTIAGASSTFLSISEKPSW